MEAIIFCLQSLKVGMGEGRLQETGRICVSTLAGKAARNLFFLFDLFSWVWPVRIVSRDEEAAGRVGSAWKRGGSFKSNLLSTSVALLETMT